MALRMTTREFREAWIAKLRAEAEARPKQLELPFPGGLRINFAPPKEIPDYLLRTCRPREEKKRKKNNRYG
jgi:hypothetical protein